MKNLKKSPFRNKILKHVFIIFKKKGNRKLIHILKFACWHDTVLVGLHKFHKLGKHKLQKLIEENDFFFFFFFDCF